MIHRSGRYGFAHGPTTAAAYGFGIIDIAPGGAKPVAYADASCILLYVLRGNATVTLGENQFSAVVGRGDAFVVYAGNWFGVRNNSHATFATAVYIHARKAAAAADAGPRRSSSSSSSSNTKLAPTMAAAPADDLAARAAVEQDTRLATTTTTARPVAHDASAPSVVSYSHLGDPPRWLAPHGDEFVRAGDYAAILGYDLCGESPAALRCPAEWSKQRRPGRPKDAVNHGSKSTKPLQAIFAVHHSSVGSESQEAVEKGKTKLRPSARNTRIILLLLLLEETWLMS
jgi:quercetin dioxygenase-like cupin family protein